MYCGSSKTIPQKIYFFKYNSAIFFSCNLFAKPSRITIVENMQYVHTLQLNSIIWFEYKACRLYMCAYSMYFKPINSSIITIDSKNLNY